jgi:hypothetical protein
MFAGTITTAKLRVTSLDVLSTNAGTITAGTLQSVSGGARFDLNNARVIFNSAPGQPSGFVRVTGAGFGPSQNYLDWYGPNPGSSTDSGIISSLTDVAALWYLKTDGSTKNTPRIRGEFECKCWANINADTNPPTIGDRFNVASVTRLTTNPATVRITFASPLANANYSCTTGAFDLAKDVVMTVIDQTINYVTIRTVSRGNGGAVFPTRLNIIIFGSNAAISNVVTPGPSFGGGTWGWGNVP